MASSFSKEELRKEINVILQNADLEKTSAKEVRLKLQDKLKVDFTSRKKELDKLIMEAVNAMQDSSESSEEESEPEVQVKRKKRKADDSDEEDYTPSKSKGSVKSKPSKKRRGSSDDDSDDDWKETKRKKKGKGTGFTRSYKLSPVLSELMGAKELPRHEVVKKIWKIIKEKNLYDPKNKQFAICDEPLEKIFGVKRFRTFGMMKHLKPHFL